MELHVGLFLLFLREFIGPVHGEGPCPCSRVFFSCAARYIAAATLASARVLARATITRTCQRGAAEVGDGARAHVAAAKPPSSSGKTSGAGTSGIARVNALLSHAAFQAANDPAFLKKTRKGDLRRSRANSEQLACFEKRVFILFNQ
jgi:hypothetical protein